MSCFCGWARLRRERLHCFYVRERFVHVHGVQQRLVVAGLELVGDDEEAVWRLAETDGDLARREAVQGGLRYWSAAPVVFSRERDDGAVRAVAFFQVLADGEEVADGALDAVGDDHRAGFAADLVLRQRLLVKVVHHDLGLVPDGVLVPLHKAPELLLRRFDLELGIVRGAFDQMVVAPDRGVVAEHVEDEALFDSLLHGVGVEGPPAPLTVLLVFLSEHLERLALGCGGEGEVARVGEHLALLHRPVDGILRHLFAFRTRAAECPAHRRCGAPALAGVGLVYDDGESAPAVLVPDPVEHERELLHGGYDDLLPPGQEVSQVGRTLGAADGRRDLGELPDGRL